MKLRQAKPILTTNATIHPWGFTIYPVLQNREDFPRPQYKTPLSSKGENKHQYGLSIAAARKIRAALNMLVYIADDKPLFPEQKDCKIFFKVNTLMLSLPSEQIHTDEQIKKLILDPFLKACKYHFGLVNYFWKAEVQDNNRIHFHLETDCYMDSLQVRSLWNHQLDRYGYIERYRENQIAKHKDGFFFNKAQYKINFKTKIKYPIDYKTQKAAFKKGTENNWSNPNSTDIHSITDVNNLAAYLVSYLSKKDLWKKSISREDSKVIARMEKEKYPLIVIQKMFPDCVKRSISGKIWDCSKKLKNTGLKIENIHQYGDAFKYMIENEVEKIYTSDHCTTYIKAKEFQKMFPPAIVELVSDHYCLMKYDCCSIPKHKILLQNEKTIQENLAANHRSASIANEVSKLKRFGVMERIGNKKPSVSPCRQTSIQFRL